MLSKHFLEIDFVKKLIFGSIIKKKLDFNKFDYEFLVKYCSSHFLLPTFYHKSLEYGLITNYPSDFSNYCSKIYQINHNRNKLLKIEALDILKVFEKNNLNYSLLKGGSLIFNNIIHPAERMIGDIDILVSNDDEKIAVKILNDLNYFSDYEYKYWNANVHPNFINNDKLFAVDLHNDLLPKKYANLLNSSEVLKRSCKTSSGIKTLCKDDMILNTIYNYQICDYATMKINYSLKKIYDYQKLKKYTKKEIKPKDIHLNCFFYFSNKLANMNNKINKGIYLNLIIINSKYMKQYKILNKSYNLICNFIIEVKNIRFKIIEFLLNQKYRVHTLKKLNFFQKEF